MLGLMLPCSISMQHHIPPVILQPGCELVCKRVYLIFCSPISFASCLRKELLSSVPLLSFSQQNSIITCHLTLVNLLRDVLIKPQSLASHPRTSELGLPPPPARASTLYYSCFFFSCSFLFFPSSLLQIFTSALMAMTFFVLHPTELGFCSVVKGEKGLHRVQSPSIISCSSLPPPLTLEGHFLSTLFHPFYEHRVEFMERNPEESAAFPSFCGSTVVQVHLPQVGQHQHPSSTVDLCLPLRFGPVGGPEMSVLPQCQEKSLMYLAFFLWLS